MAKRSKNPAFRSFPAAYAWCALRRVMRPVLRRNVATMACVVLEDKSLSGYFETAADILMSGKPTGGVRFADRDTVARKVDSGKSQIHPLINELEYRKTLFLFVNEADVPQSLRESADVFAVIGPPDPSIIEAAVYQYRHEQIAKEDAAFLAGLPITDVAIALRKGVALRRAVDLLRRTSVDSPKARKTPPAHALGSPDEGDNGKNMLERLHGYGAAVDWGLRFWKDIEDFRNGRISWSSVDRGLLLYGPPGSGKTQFALELAKACGIPLFSHSYAEWQSEGAQGDMLKAMRKAFKNAGNNAPCILLIDEIDSFSVREADHSHNASYMRGVVNGLLECLDGSARRDGVLVVGTTNHIDSVDRAILRSGRIDTHIELVLPDSDARKGILELYLGFSIDAGSVAAVAEMTQGFSGADLEVLARDVHRRARARNEATSMPHLLELLPKYRHLPDEVLRASAIHEAGHAVIGLALGHSIVEARLRDSVPATGHRHQIGSVTFEAQGPGRRTRLEMQREILLCLAGMAAEIVIFEHHDAGASGSDTADLNLATDLATRMEVAHGMGQSLVSEACDDAELRRIRQINPLIWQRVDATLMSCLTTATELARENIAAIQSLADELLRSKVLQGDEIQAFFAAGSVVVTAKSLTEDNRQAGRP